MNPEKLKKLEAEVRIGGKGTPRRKKKVVVPTKAGQIKKENSALRSMGAKHVPHTYQVHMFNEDGTVMQINYPVIHSVNKSRLHSIEGKVEIVPIEQMPPSVQKQGQRSPQKKEEAAATGGSAPAEEEAIVPTLVVDLKQAIEEAFNKKIKQD